MAQIDQDFSDQINASFRVEALTNFVQSASKLQRMEWCGEIYKMRIDT